MIGIDLFAGAGGMSLGASMAGIAVEFAVELDVHAAKTYARNHPSTTLFVGDIRTVTKKTLCPWIGRGDDLVVFGGPPCQGFSWSNAKTRNTSNDANWLFLEFLRIVNLLKPSWVVFENVQGIIDTAEGIFVQQLEESLRTRGYTTTSKRLNAFQHGVPQDRTRFFLVSSRDGRDFMFPKGTAKSLTVDDAIRDLPQLENGSATCWRKYGRARPSQYASRLRGDLDGCCNHLVTKNAQFVLNRYKHVPQGGNWECIPSRMMQSYADRSRCHTGIYHRLRPDDASIVIGNYRKNMLIHPTQDRGLSVREAARIQSFPDAFVFCGSIGFQQQQVGNAVPPLLAKSVFSQITKAEGRADD
jgi:DNA (cytosine-5)-methyltransferase 1